VTPQAVGFLEKAQKLLTEADVMLGVKLNEAAGRTAYLLPSMLRRLSFSNIWEKC
jgi:hypothetical protein